MNSFVYPKREKTTLAKIKETNKSQPFAQFLSLDNNGFILLSKKEKKTTPAKIK